MDPDAAALQLENAVLGQIVSDLQQKLQLAERRAKGTENTLRRKKAPNNVEEVALINGKLEKLKRRAVNDRVLLEQALRNKQQLEQQLEENKQRLVAQLCEADQLQQENAALLRQREQASAELQRLEKQLRKLESLQSFNHADAGNQRREAELQQSLATECQQHAAARQQVQELECRCAQLLSELHLAQANLHAAHLTARGPGGEQGSRLLQQDHPPTLQQLAQLDDLDGVTHFQCSSPTQSCSGSLAPASREPPDSTGDPAHPYQQHPGAAQIAGSSAEQAESSADLEPAQLHWYEDTANLAAGLQRQVDKLQRRNTQLQMALADAHLQHGQATLALRQEIKALQSDMHGLKRERDAAQQQLQVLHSASAAARANEEALLPTVDRLHEEVVEYALRMNHAVEHSAALMQEKKQWVEQLAGLEQQLEACRAELTAARLQQARRLYPPTVEQAVLEADASTSQALVPAEGGITSELGTHEQLLHHLVEAQAQETALRSVLAEVRQEQLATCKAVSNELRRVHALEKLRMADLREGQRLQRRVGELQKEVTGLYTELAEARM